MVVHRIILRTVLCRTIGQYGSIVVLLRTDTLSPGQWIGRVLIGFPSGTEDIYGAFLDNSLHVFIHTYIRTHIHIYIYVYTCTHTYIPTHIRTSIHTNVHIDTHLFM